MAGAVIKIGDNLIRFDGRNWEAISGEKAGGYAEAMKIYEWRYERNAESHPNIIYNIANEAAKDFGGEVIECEELDSGPPDRIH